MIKPLVISALLCLGVLACTPQQYLNRRQANRSFLAADQTEKWALALRYDPYLDGITTVFKPKERPHLYFDPNGQFSEFQTDTHSAGVWQIHKENKQLVLAYSLSNSQKVPKKQPQILQYTILKKDKDSLILGIQGRHGIVQHKYVRAR